MDALETWIRRNPLAAIAARSHGFGCGIAVLALLTTACGNDSGSASGPSGSADEDTAGEDSAGDDDAGDTGVDEDVELLSDVDRLVRVAMALKGTRPSLEEMAAVQEDPTALESIVDGYLASAQFGDTVRDVENQTLLIRDEEDPNPPGAILDGAFAAIHAIDYTSYYYEEPLKIIEDVVVNDRPYTEIVTTDTTMSTRWGPLMWVGIADDFDPDGPEWQRLGHDDGRPAAGILATGAFFKRYGSSNRNAHREAAAAVAETLLCLSYSDRDIPLGSVDLTEDGAVEAAILNNETCVSCHQTLDPLAGFLAGKPRQTGFGPFPSLGWDSSVVGTNDNKTGRETGYYGLPGETLDDLGQLMAADHRFSGCAARRYISYLSQIRLHEVPHERVAAAQAALIDSGMNVKAMVKSIVLSDAFAVSHSADPALAEDLVGVLQTRPEQLSRMFADLTGFTWQTALTSGEATAVVDVTTNSQYGFKVHGGGLDNVIKVLPVHQYSSHASVFLRSLAEEAAGAVTASDFAKPADERALLHLVEPDSVEEGAVRDQLAFLHWRVLAEDVTADSENVDETYALFEQVHAQTQDATTTWKVVLTALFQDFRVAYH